eukprot:TRINITY_DN1739_c0_g1_i1.p1 TRINITY_DN1739_c0_g1~~TRINITY_DN1739_c0_g1_i1.p1  ORF type:complete len:273 (-),score=84.01 TRINITY_DN1739_c0_g1_i1:416-1168(-)
MKDVDEDDDWVPVFDCPRCAELEGALAAERERKAKATATALYASCEALKAQLAQQHLQHAIAQAQWRKDEDEQRQTIAALRKEADALAGTKRRLEEEQVRREVVLRSSLRAELERDLASVLGQDVVGGAKSTLHLECNGRDFYVLRQERLEDILHDYDIIRKEKVAEFLVGPWRQILGSSDQACLAGCHWVSQLCHECNRVVDDCCQNRAVPPLLFAPPGDAVILRACNAAAERWHPHHAEAVRAALVVL